MPIATFPLEHDHAYLELASGHVYLEWPEKVTTADVSDLREWIQIVLRVMEREAARSERENAASEAPSEPPPPDADDVIDAEVTT